MSPITKPIDNSYINIELGAGCGNFGHQFFPKCYTTEFNAGLTCDMSHIHHFCSAYETDLANDRFTTIVISNPYDYGFNNTENANALINELFRLLQTGGKIVILSNYTNKYGAPDLVIKRLNEIGFVPIIRPIQVENINHELDYPGFEFKQTAGIPAYPNRRITIDVIK